MIVHIRAPKNVAFVLVTPVYDGEWSDAYVSGAADLDSEDSDDKGNFTDMDNELTEIQATGVYSLDITQAEMNFDLKVVKMTSSTTGANIPLFVIHTYEDRLITTNTELSAIPASTDGLDDMIQFIFEKLGNKETFNKDTGVSSLKKADGTTELGASTSTDDGTTVTRGEMT